jgi:hypothetical protein
MTAPLPCPFCGEQPEVLPKDPKRSGNAWGAVRCANEDCHASECSVGDGEAMADDRGSDLYKEAAIRRWNTRWKAPEK